MLYFAGMPVPISLGATGRSRKSVHVSGLSGPRHAGITFTGQDAKRGPRVRLAHYEAPEESRYEICESGLFGEVHI